MIVAALALWLLLITFALCAVGFVAERHGEAVGYERGRTDEARLHADQARASAHVGAPRPRPFDDARPAHHERELAQLLDLESRRPTNPGIVRNLAERRTRAHR